MIRGARVVLLGIFLMTIWAGTAFGDDTIRVCYGEYEQAYTKLLVGRDDYIRVRVSCNDPSVYVADLHIPLATRDTYISYRPRTA